MRKDSGIDKIEDMKGKVAATNGLGSGVDIAMRSALSKHGLAGHTRLHHDRGALPHPQGDPEGEEGRPRRRRAAVLLRSGTATNSPSRCSTRRSGFGSIALSFWAARKGFIDKNRAALVDLLEDYGAVLRWYYDPANHKEAVALTAGFLKRPPAAFEGWLFTKRDFYRDLDGKPDLKVVQASIDKVKELGFIKETLEVREIRRPEPGRGGREAAAVSGASFTPPPDGHSRAFSYSGAIGRPRGPPLRNRRRGPRQMKLLVAIVPVTPVMSIRRSSVSRKVPRPAWSIAT